MPAKITSSTVNEVLAEGKDVDRQERMTKLQGALEKVHKDIAEQERLEKRWAIVQSAFTKLKRELGKTLTQEERDAIDGIYLFLHSGHVDMVRHIPSSTSKGEDVKLERDLDMAEALKDLGNLK